MSFQNIDTSRNIAKKQKFDKSRLLPDKIEIHHQSNVNHSINNKMKKDGVVLDMDNPTDGEDSEFERY